MTLPSHRQIAEDHEEHQRQDRQRVQLPVPAYRAPAPGRSGGAESDRRRAAALGSGRRSMVSVGFMFPPLPCRAGVLRMGSTRLAGASWRSWPTSRSAPVSAEPDGRGRLAAGAAEPQLHVARLDDPAPAQAGERGEVGRDVEGDLRGLAGLQGDPGEADQPDHRPGGLRDRVVQVQLDDLGAGPGAGVADGDPHRASPSTAQVAGPSSCSPSGPTAWRRSSRRWCSSGRGRTGTRASGRSRTPASRRPSGGAR